MGNCSKSVVMNSVSISPLNVFSGEFKTSFGFRQQEINSESTEIKITNAFALFNILQYKQRSDNKNQNDGDVLPHIYEIRKVFFVGFLELTHSAKIRILGIGKLTSLKPVCHFIGSSLFAFFLGTLHQFSFKINDFGQVGIIYWCAIIDAGNVTSNH